MYLDWYMYAILFPTQQRIPSVYLRGGISLELEFIVDIWCVLCGSFSTRMHLARVVPFNAALLVSDKGIARQV